jgi:hypothetical protein
MLYVYSLEFHIEMAFNFLVTTLLCVLNQLITGKLCIYIFFSVTSSVQQFYAPLRENAHSPYSERRVIELISISHPVRGMSDVCFVTYTLSNMR